MREKKNERGLRPGREEREPLAVPHISPPSFFSLVQPLFYSSLTTESLEQALHLGSRNCTEAIRLPS